MKSIEEYPLHQHWYDTFKCKLYRCEEKCAQGHSPEVLEAIFGCYFARFSTHLSPSDLEFSFASSLLTFLDSLFLCRPQCCGRGVHFDPKPALDRHVLLISAIGRYTKERGPSGKNWTLGTLFEHLQQLGVEQNFGLSTEESLRYLWEVLVTTNLTTNTRSSECASSMEELRNVPYDEALLRMKVTEAHIGSGSATSNCFRTKDMSLETLSQLCGIEAQWTSRFSEHLSLDSKGKKLNIFWDISLVQTHDDDWTPAASSLFWCSSVMDE